MIESRSFRARGSRESIPMTDREQTPDEAMSSFLIYEIGYGGRVTKLSPTSVTVVTNVMAVEDTTIFSGTEEEMRLLYRTAQLAVVLDPYNQEANPEVFNLAIDLLQHWSGGNPLLVTHGHGLIFGKLSVPMILCHLVPNADPESHKKLMKTDRKDALAAVLLTLKGECNLEEALSMC